VIRRVLTATSAAAVAVALTATSTGPLSASPGEQEGWYLALGDSLAAGYQPGRGDSRTGGYAGRVLESVRAQSPRTRLVNMGCSGETTTTLIGGGTCRYEQGSQLGAAAAFLEAHPTSTRLVTVDIGANNVTPCAGGGVDPACVATRALTVRRELTGILARLRRAAPDVHIVVLNYYDALLATWLAGPGAAALASGSVTQLDVLNAAIAESASSAGARLADVAAAFHTPTTVTVLLDGRAMPLNVALVCQWTWMCASGDIHANDTGYAVIASAVNAVR